MLLFQKDFEGSRLGGLLRALGQAKELLSPLTPRDRVAVLTFDSHLRLHLDFTADLAAVRRTLDESVLLRWPDPVEAGPSPSLAAHLDPDRRPATPRRRSRPSSPSDGRSPTLPGAKTVLLFGYGLGRAAGRHRRSRPRLRRRAPGPRGGAGRRLLPRRDPTPTGTRSRSASRRSPADTGGQYFKVHENAGVALRRVAAALSGHYVLAFERPEGRRGEHRVRLALDGRRGTVLTRSRYVD